MQATELTREAGWKTYLKCILFLLPAFVFSAMAATFILPKVQVIWRDAGLGNAPELWMVHMPTAILRNGMLGCALILAILAALELTVKSWPRFRRPVVAVLVFLINGTALFTILIMSAAVTMAAPALAQAHTGPGQAVYELPSTSLQAAR